MVLSHITIKGLLSLPILIPLIIGFRKCKSADTVCRLFIFFLMVGLMVDLLMWLLLSLKETSHLLNIFNIYSLIESLFFFWFIQKTTLANSVKSIAKICLYAAIPFWIICIFIYPQLTGVEDSRSAPFDTVYEVIVSFLAGFSLLQYAEKEASITASYLFWLTLGIFFYCFCTFYLMTFLGTIISGQIWFLNNIFNIISYLFYAVGFWKINRVKSV